MPDDMRIFIAIELPEEVLSTVIAVQGELRSEGDTHIVRWVARGGLHITLKFLGNIPATRLKEVEGAVAEAVAGHAPFCLSLVGLGCFPRPHRPRVLWVGIEGELEKLLSLQKVIEGKLVHLGFLPEGREFSPHVTIGRVKRQSTPKERARLGQILQSWQVENLGQFSVEAVSVMRSQLHPAGAKYTCLASIRLEVAQ